MPEARAADPIASPPDAAAAPASEGARQPAGGAAPRASGPQRALAKLGLVRDIDLALHLPLRYEDETRLTRVADARDGETVQVEGVVTACRVEQRARRQLLVTLDDGSGEPLRLRFLHFWPSHQKTLAVGGRVRARGELRGGRSLWGGGREMVHPSFRRVDDGTPLASALTPVYPTSAQLPQAYLRKAVASALQRAPLDELLPPDALPPGLPTLREALRTLHQPPAGGAAAALDDRAHPAWQRLKYEELLAQQLSQLQAKRERAALRAPALATRPGGLHERLLAALPFALTAAQRRAAEEIAGDLAGGVPMHRLLQGDVGSGKTVVSALAATLAIDAGWQCALMAPTEILAEQHFRKLVGWLEPLGVGIAWLTGSRKGRGRAAMLQAVASGAARLVVGTHAVIQDDVAFARLGLAVVDEQHRFGVAQRLALRRKLAGDALEPHLLMMSATPIPRTLAMSYYADLDVSTIDELPPGRTPIVTKLFSDARRDQVIARIRDEVAAGRQVYWVCPLIEEGAEPDGAAPPRQAELDGPAASGPDAAGARDEDDRRGATSIAAGESPAPFPPLAPRTAPSAAPATRPARTAARSRAPAASAGAPPLELRNVTATHAELSAALPGVPVGLIHGRLPAGEKAAVMAAFAEGRMAVLVATTVIEVGVDVPNASLMVVEHAERFGLAQLHQLRGRVGRGPVASVCVLLYTAPLSDGGKARLKAMAGTTDGFEIARRDLEIRGPGEFMGARQSGDALLRFADPSTDGALLERARRAAPRLLDRHAAAARAHVDRWLGSRADYLKA